MTSSRATLADVARRANVSRTQASDALAGRGRVSDESRQRVLAAADELGYRSNTLAQSIRTGTKPLLALCLNPMHVVNEGGLTPFWGNFLTGFLQSVSDNGCFAMVELADGSPRFESAPVQAIITADDSLSAEIVGNADFRRVVAGPLLAEDMTTPKPGARIAGFRHDYVRAAEGAAHWFTQAGCRRVSVLYTSRIRRLFDELEPTLNSEFAYAGIAWNADLIADSPQAVAEATARNLQSGADGIFNLAMQLPALMHSVEASGRRISRTASDGVVVLHQSEGPGDLTRTEDVAFLHLNGLECGEIVAENVIATLNGREPQFVTLPHEICYFPS